MTDSEISLQRRLDAICDDFEIDWSADSKADFDRYLQRIGEDSRERLLRMLVELDVELREHTGQEVLPSDYRELGESIVAHVERLSHDDPLATRSRRVTRRLSRTDRFLQDTNAQDGIYSKGSQVGPYKLLQQIGSGGMGTVWMAEQLQPVRRRVALKLIRNDVGSRETIARFEAERQALAMMDHQHIAKVLDAGTTELGTPYFVMELVKGVPITQFCDDHQLGIKERLELFIPVCKAIQHAHQKGIVHRDLKPSNVLVTMYDGEAVPKVIDFGLAKALEHTTRLTDRTLFTEFGMVVGTLQYMSPEQAEMNALDVDTRTDIYSLGVMLYELLTGSTPLDKETMGNHALLQLLTIIKEKEPPRPSLRLSSVREQINGISQRRRIAPSKLQQILRGELDWVVMKALEKDRRRRYETASDFAHDLQRYLSGDAVQAKPPSVAYRARKFARKNWGLVTSLTSIAVLLVTAVIVSAWFAVEANEAKIDALDQKGVAEARTEEARHDRVRALKAEQQAQSESKRARDAEASSTYQLALARWDAGRVYEARQLLDEIPVEYRIGFEWGYCRRLFEGSDYTLYGHEGSVLDVAVSVDGSVVASAGSDGTAIVWDSTLGEERLTLNGHDAAITALAVSPNKDQIATASLDMTIRLWTLSSGKELLTLKGHTNAVTDVAFSPDGNRLASTSNDRTVKIWNPHDGALLQTFSGHGKDVFCIDYSPDSTLIATGSWDKTVRIWDAETGAHIRTLSGHEGGVSEIDFSPNGRFLASCGLDRTVRIWNVETGEQISTFRGHDGPVSCVAFSPDGASLVSSSSDKTIKLWDPVTGKELGTLRGHLSQVAAFCFAPDGGRVFSAGSDGTVKAWDLKDGHAIALRGHGNSISSVDFNSVSEILASGSWDGTIRFWNPRTGQMLKQLQAHQHGVSAVSFSPTAQILASGGKDATVRIWNVETGQCLATLFGHQGDVRRLAFSRNGMQLASGSVDGRIKIWDIETRMEVIDLHAHDSFITGIAFLGEDRLISCGDSRVRIWRIVDGRELQELKAPILHITGVAISPDGNTIASSNSDGSIRLWDAKSGLALNVFDVEAAKLERVMFSPDGSRILATILDGAIIVLDARTGAELLRIESPGQTIHSLAISHDGTRIATGISSVLSGFSDFKLCIRSCEPDEQVTFIRAQPEFIARVGVDSNRRRVYFESQDEPFRWDSKKLERVLRNDWPSIQSATDSRGETRWKVVPNGLDLVLVDNSFKYNSTELAYRNQKALWDESWHLTLAQKFEEDQNWEAALFHRVAILHHKPSKLIESELAKFASDRVTEQDEQAVALLVSSNPWMAKALESNAHPKQLDIDEDDSDTLIEEILKKVSSAAVREGKTQIHSDDIVRAAVLAEEFSRRDFLAVSASCSYRSGDYEKAIEAAMISIDKESAMLPPNRYRSVALGVLAMSFFRLEQFNTAREYHSELASEVQDKSTVESDAIRAFLSEVDELLRD